MFLLCMAKTEHARRYIKSINASLDKIDRGNTWEETEYMREKMDALKREVERLVKKGY